MEYLSVADVLQIHSDVIEMIGGSHGVRNEGALESAVAMSATTFGGEDLYPTPIERLPLWRFR